MPNRPVRAQRCSAFDEASEDTAFLINEQRPDEKLERSPARDKPLRLLFYFLFVSSIVNAFYDCLLYLRMTRSPAFDTFCRVCRPGVTTALFLDLCLSAATLILALYALRLVRDCALCVRVPVEELHTYFAGYTVFWLGVKGVMGLFVARSEDCLFTNLHEAAVAWLPRYRVAALIGVYALEAAALAWSWRALAEMVLARKQRVAQILLYD